jgi:hypothetical protein
MPGWNPSVEDMRVADPGRWRGFDTAPAARVSAISGSRATSLDSTAQISAFGKLKLAICARRGNPNRTFLPTADDNRGYLLFHCY